MDKTNGIGTTSIAWLSSKSSIAPPKLQPQFDFVIIIDWLRARQIPEFFLFHLFHLKISCLKKKPREHEMKRGSRIRVSGAAWPSIAISMPMYAPQNFISNLSKPLLCSSLACVGRMLLGCACVLKVNLCVRHLDRRTVICDLVDCKPNLNRNTTRGAQKLTVGSNRLWKKATTWCWCRML